MASKLASISYFLLLAVPSLAPTISAQALTSCFVLNGRKTYDSGYRCDNSTTGHSACCGAGATCYSNGLCEQFNGPVVDYLRVGCTDPTWQDPACLNQCASIQNFTTAGLRFCSASVEASTSYCCDDGTQGVGSFHCCDSPRSIFRIAPAATVMAQIPLSQLPASSTSPASQTSTSAPTSAAPVTSSSDSPSDEGHPNTTVKVGIAMGVSGTLIILGLIGFSLWRRRRDSHQNRPFELQGNEVAGSQVYGRNEIPKAFQSANSPVSPMGYSVDKHYEGAHQEMPGRNRPYELGA